MTMKVIHFRVLLDYDENVFRDIEIALDDSFSKLHDIIQEAFGFDNSQMASFYVSNHEWEKGQEITLMDMSEPTGNGEPIWLMHDISLDKIIFEKGQKLIYVFDFLLMWCFYVDVIDIFEFDEAVILPRITQSYGLAPDQYNKTADIQFDGVELPTSDMEGEESEFDQLFKVFDPNDHLYDES